MTKPRKVKLLHKGKIPGMRQVYEPVISNLRDYYATPSRKVSRGIYQDIADNAVMGGAENIRKIQAVTIGPVRVLVKEVEFEHAMYLKSKYYVEYSAECGFWSFDSAKVEGDEK